MYLKQLEVHGFKSFAEKIELSFGNTINAIVGPNGSGKSNISDAIRWVLGEQSVKALRGNKMEDVIFAGSDSEKALGFAEVSLCIDNSDRKIPVDYTEINIMRRMYRSGESEYFINKTSCRLKDIYELFMDTGIGRDGYSIIGQGRIDEILSNKSEDRRNVFEEAAGIVKYKTRKHEAEKKLEQTNQNIVRLGDIIEELESQLGPLKEQAEVAKRYRSIMEELKSIEINIMLNSIDKFRSRLSNAKQEAENIQSLIDAKNSSARQLEHKQDELKRILNDIEASIDMLSEDIHHLENSKEKMEGESNVLQVRINNL
ncbi:MAG: AAA family ATPase, partial [Clostridiaceae bacterium]|nr:AAA family ATPase [Clostridiaceae bacterium]